MPKHLMILYAAGTYNSQNLMDKIMGRVQMWNFHI